MLQRHLAMSNYDAVKLAAEAARNTSSVTRNLKEVAGTIKHTTTCARPLYGAPGMIAFSPESHGNPINKAMPIMQIDADGKTKQVDLVWSDGVPFNEENRKSSSSGQG